MSDLTVFLLERVAEDMLEVDVLPAGVRDESAGPNGVGWAEVGAISDVLLVSVGRMMAELEAKRDLLVLHRPSPAVAPGYDPYCVGCWEEGGQDGAPSYPCKTVRILASVYADHPDYNAEEWKQ